MENEDSKNFVVNCLDIIFGKLTILSDTKLNLQYGDHYGLIGKNGIGKTSLLNFIAEKYNGSDIIYVKQEEPESDLSILETLLSADKEVYCAAQRLKELENSELLDVEEYMALGQKYGVLTQKSKAHARKILSGLGFSLDDHMKPVKILSGGWRMRVALAKALFVTPTLLLLDEPTNHLDLHCCLWLTKYLKGYPKTILVVSHDKFFLNEVCTHIISIHHHKLFYYRGNYDNYKKIFELEQTKVEKDWLASKKAEKKDKESTNKPKKKVQKLVCKPDKEYVVKIKFLQPALMKGNLVRMENVEFGYSKLIYNGLNLEIDATTRAVIVGANGTGKSTLLNLITGKLEPTTGTADRAEKLIIGYYDQHFENSMPDMTGFGYIQHLNKEINLGEAHKYLSMFGLEPQYHKISIGKLSGGQKARVKLASLCVLKPHLLVLDEPSNHLDITTIESLINALQNFDGAIIVVTHNYDFITKLGLELWTISDGDVCKCDLDYDDYVEEIYRQYDEE